MVALWLISFCLFVYFESAIFLKFVTIFNFKMENAFQQAMNRADQEWNWRLKMPIMVSRGQTQLPVGKELQ